MLQLSEFFAGKDSDDDNKVEFLKASYYYDSRKIDWQQTKVLGAIIDAHRSFAQHTIDIGVQAGKCFGKLARLTATL